MAEPTTTSGSAQPQICVIIAVYNDWAPLEGCLKSLSLQEGAAPFEVVVVDDGSDQEAPNQIRNSTAQLTIIRQPHAGTATARNLGIRHCNAPVLLFTDADCRPQPNCISSLSAVLRDHAQQDYFQLHLIGDCSNLVGRAEELRLRTIQRQTLQSDGRIRYLNTAGFAVRRRCVDAEVGLFDPSAERAEDTLLLASLIERGDLPVFVSDAVVQHSISLSLMACLPKDIRSGWIEGSTYTRIRRKGIQIRMGHWGRIRMLGLTWSIARQASIGKVAWFVLVTRQMLERSATFAYRFWRACFRRESAA